MKLPELQKIKKKDLPKWLEPLTQQVTKDEYYLVNTGDSKILETVKKKNDLVVLGISGFKNYCVKRSNYKSSGGRK